MLIVFLAVPALQRNSRNTQRKNDISALLAYVNEIKTNRNNQFPASCNGSQASCFLRDVETSIYDSNSNSVSFFRLNNPVLSGITFAGSNFDRVIIVNFARCNADNEATGTNASRNSLVALFAVETSDGNTFTQCVEG